MRRKLVIHDDTAGHPFRRMVNGGRVPMPGREATRKQPLWKREDSHLFVISFSAFFVVFYTLIS